MKRLLMFIGIIAVLAAGGIGGIFWERRIKKEPPPAPIEKEVKKGREVLYYKCPMGLPDFSDNPGKAKCGMDYIPVYKDEAGQQAEPGEIVISPEKIQRIGVRSQEVKVMPLTKKIRTVAAFDYDERRIFTINSKVEGWIERLYVNATGKEIKKGDPLLDIYSPDLVSTQEEYLLALETRERLGSDALKETIQGAQRIIEASRRRLINWDISDSQIETLENTRRPERTLALHSPVNGVVTEKMALQGMKAMSGEKLFTIADLSNIWLNADIYEYELSLIKTGQKAAVTINAYPGMEFNAVVSYIYPYLSPDTRTAKVRLEMSNREMKLKPGMYANVQIESLIANNAVSVPEEAVIDTGERRAVILDLGGGRFKIQEVEVGLKGEGYYQILSGLTPGQMVVTSPNFLIDSESSFRSAAQTMLGMEHGKPSKTAGKDEVKKEKGHEGMPGM